MAKVAGVLDDLMMGMGIGWTREFQGCGAFAEY
jgi:hypothetical protein